MLLLLMERRMNTTDRAYWRRRTRRQRVGMWLGRVSVVPTALLAMMIGSLGVLALQETDFGAWLTAVPVSIPALPATREPMGQRRDFVVCGAQRITCVVDGDTFWLDGTKYRIADINTPEVGSPRCASEAQLGRRATERLTQLLSAGPFTLAPADRDEDQYGRKLRIVRRDGQSVGQLMVAEGLAHEWQGYRQGWC
jgi:micrococcal nuclease